MNTTISESAIIIHFSIIATKKDHTWQFLCDGEHGFVKRWEPNHISDYGRRDKKKLIRSRIRLKLSLFWF